MQKRRTVCTCEFDAVGGEDMGGCFGVWDGSSEFPGLIDGIEQEPEGNGAFDVAGGDESRKM